MKNEYLNESMWREAEKTHVPTLEQAWEIIQMDEEEYVLVAQEETDAFFRKVRKEEKRQIKEYEAFLRSSDESQAS